MGANAFCNATDAGGVPERRSVYRWSRGLGFVSPDDETPVQRTVTVRSLGDAALEPGTAVATGADAAAFDIVWDDCSGATLAVGETCDLTVEFTPNGSADRGPARATWMLTVTSGS